MLNSIDVMKLKPVVFKQIINIYEIFEKDGIVSLFVYEICVTYGISITL